MSFLRRTVLKSPISRAGGKNVRFRSFTEEKSSLECERVGSARAAAAASGQAFARAQAFQRDISGDNYARDCRVK